MYTYGQNMEEYVEKNQTECIQAKNVEKFIFPWIQLECYLN